MTGSAYPVAPHYLITNAHVVSGTTRTTVSQGPPGARGTQASVVFFDPERDVAILRVLGLNQPPLRLAADPTPGTAAAILGYPLDGAFDAEPGRIGQTSVVRTQNAYGEGPVLRSIASLRGRVRPGNSGGPMVDAHGQVVATVFAALTLGRLSLAVVPARKSGALPRRPL